MTVYWITDEPYPTSPDVLAEATAAGAEQVLHGIPESLSAVIPAGTLGLFAVPDPEPPVGPIWPPLDPTGALATLLVVTGVLTLHDAANAIQEEPDHLIAEAEAWSLGQQ